MTAEVQAGDFDIAKALFDQLKDVSADRQKRILGWVAESLGISLASPAAPDAHAMQLPAAAGAAPPPGQGTGTDIKSFVAAKAPKSDKQFATTVAYYYRFEAPLAQRRDTITSEILQEAARLAGRQRLTKPGKTLGNSKTSGYLDSTGRGEYSINTVGENLVAMTLPGGAEVGRGKLKRTTKKTRGR